MTSPPAKKTRQSTQKYLRNVYSSQFFLRLTDAGRIELRPRGQRGDMVALTKEQEKNAAVLANVNLGTVEVISSAEAHQIAQAQSTNQQAVHPALATLRDSLGNEYDQTDIEVTADPQTVGETVAYLKDGEIITENIPGKGQRMVRDPRSVGPNIVTNIPGSDPEYRHLINQDNAAKSGTSLEDVLGLPERLNP